MVSAVSQAESGSELRQPGRILAWLQLVRLPTVFTAVSNVLAGCIIASGMRSPRELISDPSILLIVISGICLYYAGMVLNDVFDAKCDARERPERPVPSGRISVRAAAVFGTILMAAGLVVAAFAARAGHGTGAAFQVAIALAVTILLYDCGLKNTVAGPIAMGSCRFLNLLLGASAVVGLSELMTMPIIGLATALGIYVTGVTWIARSEAGTVSSSGMQSGVALCVIGITSAAVTVMHSGISTGVTGGSLLLYGLLLVNIMMRGIAAVRDPEPGRVRRTIGMLLLCIILLDAAAVFGLTGSGALAAVIVLLIVPAMFLRRYVPMS